MGRRRTEANHNLEMHWFVHDFLHSVQLVCILCLLCAPMDNIGQAGDILRRIAFGSP